MSEIKYRICLTVPLGRRNGIMLLKQSNGQFTGWLDVLGQKTAFSGTLSGNGQLTLSGVLQTLVSTLPYTATGTVRGRQILLKLKTTAGASYLLTGEELEPNDNNL